MYLHLLARWITEGRLNSEYTTKQPHTHVMQHKVHPAFTHALIRTPLAM